MVASALLANLILVAGAFQEDGEVDLRQIKADIGVLKTANTAVRKSLKSIQEKDIAEIQQKQSEISSAIEKIEERLKMLEDAGSVERASSLKKVEERLKLLEDALTGGRPTTAPPKALKATDNNKSLLALHDWDYKFEKGRLGDPNYRISYVLRNGFPKGIKLIEGSIRFEDLLGNRLYGIKIEEDLRIAAGKTASSDGLYRINQFINAEARMAKMEKDDVKAIIDIDKIVFDDNTVAGE